MIMSTKEICKRGLSMTISLTLGNSRLPLAHRLVGNVELFRQLPLGPPLLLPQPGHKGPEGRLVHVVHVHHLARPAYPTAGNLATEQR